MDEDLYTALQVLLQKYINGDALQLFPNEIKGFNGFDWTAFSLALVVSDGKFMGDTIEILVTEVNALLKYL